MAMLPEVRESGHAAQGQREWPCCHSVERPCCPTLERSGHAAIKCRVAMLPQRERESHAALVHKKGNAAIECTVAMLPKVRESGHVASG